MYCGNRTQGKMNTNQFLATFLKNRKFLRGLSNKKQCSCFHRGYSHPEPPVPQLILCDVSSASGPPDHVLYRGHLGSVPPSHCATAASPGSPPAALPPCPPSGWLSVLSFPSGSPPGRPRVLPLLLPLCSPHIQTSMPSLLPSGRHSRGVL